MHQHNVMDATHAMLLYGEPVQHDELYIQPSRVSVFSPLTSRKLANGKSRSLWFNPASSYDLDD